MKNIIGKLYTNKFLKLYKILILVLIIFFLGLFFVSKITLPGALDLPRQIQNGKDVLSGNYDVLTKNVYSYTEPNHSFANHHWLFGVFAYILFQITGWFGLTIFKLIFIVLTYILLFWIALKRSNFWIVSIFSIPTIFILIGRTAFRPEIFSYFFVILFLYLLFYIEKNPKSNKIYWLIPLEFIWVNTHLFFPIGLMLIAGFLFERLILNLNDWKADKLIRKLLVVLIGATSILYFNPFGIGGVVYSLMVNTSATFPIHSMEVNSIFNALKIDPSWANISIYFFIFSFIFLLFSFISIFILRLKRKLPLFANNFIFLFLASVGSAGLSYFIFRALPLFSSIFLLSICINCNELFYVLKDWLKLKGILISNMIKAFFMVLLPLLIIFLIFFGQSKIMQYQDQGFGLSKEALASAEFFKKQNLKGPIFNDTDSGSYLIGELYPQEKVFTDNRFGDAYSSSFFSDIYLPMIRDEKKWKEGLAKYNFNVIFMYHYDQGDGVEDFLFSRIYDPDWVWVYVDKYNFILVRNVIENKEVIDKYRITYANIYNRIRYLTTSNDARDKLNAADTLNLIGHTDFSIPLYLQYLSLKPESGEVWFVLGRTELLKVDQNNSNPSLAAMYLERSIKEGWKTWRTYSYLALAYKRMGQLDKLKEAVREELKIVPDGEDAQRWLKIIADEELNQKNDNGNKQ